MRALLIALLLIACARPELGEATDEPRDAPSLDGYAESRERSRKAFEQFERLTDPENPPVIGTTCYFSGAPPPGRLALEILVEMGRVDLLRRLLKAPTMEARLYAAIGVFRLGAMTHHELETFADSIDRDVRVCSGCIEYAVSPREALGYYDVYPTHRGYQCQPCRPSPDELGTADRPGSMMGF